jgi:TonB family protein
MFRPILRSLRFLAFPLFLACVPWARSQQTSTPAEPKDPKELMLAAARLNSLTAPGMNPWHIRATYQSIDENGSITDEGTFDEWWANPQQSKRVLAGKSTSETEYTTEKGDFRVASHGDVPLLLTTVQNYLISPLPNDRTVENSTYALTTIEAGTLKLNCLAPEGIPEAEAFCVGTNDPILRIGLIPSSSIQALYNRILGFHGKTIAGDFKLMRNGKATLKLHVDTIESLDPANQAAFTPAQDEVLVPIPHLVNIAGGIAVGMLQYKVAPDYPSIAKEARVSGTVVIQAIIGKDGHTGALKVISGPPMLQQAALDAVRQWRYRPYLLNGEPVEVRTSINVIFSLSR